MPCTGSPPIQFKDVKPGIALTLRCNQHSHSLPLCHLKGGVGDPRIVLTGYTGGAFHAGLGGFAIDGNFHRSGRIALTHTVVPGLEGMGAGGQTGDLQLDDAAAVGMIHVTPSMVR